MKKSKIASKEPIAAEVKEGQAYYWCSCGKSSTEPFCDGAHKDGTSFSPLVFTADKDETVYLCGCKQTKKPPYCDGSHEDLNPVIF